MNQMLKPGQEVRTEDSRMTCTVGQLLGGGSQGEVYRARLGNQEVAVKWYFKHWLRQDPQQRQRLETAIRSGAPTDRFLWPLELAAAPGFDGFGYIMPLREPQFRGLVEVVARQAEPRFRELATAGFELAHNYLQLHAKGLCYQDISFGNVFLNPATGEIRICDNDNVTVDGGTGAVGGTPRFIAPEIVRGEAAPSARTDLFSLAVVLFYIFMLHHPLEGRRETSIRCFDVAAMRKLYGEEPLFIFDPDDSSNRPDPACHEAVLNFWPVYPRFLQTLFIRAFTDGIRDAEYGRVREGEWRAAMVRLRDSILYCGGCGSENFYDLQALQDSGGQPGSCWACRAPLRLPYRACIDASSLVMLNHDTCLFPHHLDSQRRWDFSSPVAAVTVHPTNPRLWGLKNLSDRPWTSTSADGTITTIEPARSVALGPGRRISFGTAEAEIR